MGKTTFTLIAALSLTILAQADVNSLLSNLTATVAATDYGRRNPSRVKGLVNDYYDNAVRIRQEQDEVIPL